MEIGVLRNHGEGYSFEKDHGHSSRLGVIGLGYVGLPLAVEFSRAGLEVLGIDTDSQRVRMVNDGKSYLPDIQSNELSSLVIRGRLRASTHYHHIRDLDCINICVPTPLRKTNLSISI